MYNHTRYKLALVHPGIMPLSNTVQALIDPLGRLRYQWRSAIRQGSCWGGGGSWWSPRGCGPRGPRTGSPNTGSQPGAAAALDPAPNTT